VLDSVRDSQGSPAIFTANAVVANPDFERIRENDFSAYFYRTIEQTFAETGECERSLQLWKEARTRRLFVMHSHGREHLNVATWLHYLRQKDPESRLGFDLGFYGLSTTIATKQRPSFLAALRFDDAEGEREVSRIVTDGLRIFRQLMGYPSRSFIAPNYTWGRSLEKVLSDDGVTYLQGCYRHRYVGESRSHFRPLGAKNRWGQYAMVRNAWFEPSQKPASDCVDSCLRDVATAFLWRKPAVICSHRLNYIGAIFPRNRDANLKSLSLLLKTITEHWPNAEFMSTDELGDLIHG